MFFKFSRIEKVFIVCSVLLIALAARLVFLQVVVAKDLAIQGLMSRVHELKAETMRGSIYDRNLECLTNINKRTVVTFFPSQCKEKEQVIQLLCQYAKMNTDKAKEVVLSAKRPIKILDNINKAEESAIKNLAIEGIVISDEVERYSNLASHIIGYVNKSDNRGISGLEASYNDVLKDGGQKYLAALMDAKADLIPGLSYRKITLTDVGKEQALVLTIDKTIQEKTEKVFDAYAKKGAVIVMEPNTGEILAMVSRPNFNAQNLSMYLNDKNSPLINRAITAYQPGSVLKLAVAAAALEKKQVTPKQKFVDQGYINVDGTVFHGWDQKAGKRELTFSQAIAYSSNPVLIQVGLKLGMNELVVFLEKLGFGKKTSLDLFGEEAGNLPDKENFYRGEIANLSIGQGECEATPLQVAQLVATIVNDGVKINPLLVKKIIDADKNILKEYFPSDGERVFSAENASALRKMMEGVTSYGTGQAAFVSQGGSAGKTGSAETGRINKDGKGINHAWFAGYAPITQPRYVVVVFVEEGMSGGDVAAPIFKEIIENIQNKA